MNARPGDGTQPIGRQTIHGITEDNEYITMLEASGQLGGVSFSNRSTTESVVITANCMLVGSEHFDRSRCVRRLRFSSAVVERVLRLWARPDFCDGHGLLKASSATMLALDSQPKFGRVKS